MRRPSRWARWPGARREATNSTAIDSEPGAKAETTMIFKTRWPLMITLSAVLGGLLQLLHFPAALLLGPLIAGVVVALRGEAPAISRPAFMIAQTVVGCLIAQSMPLDVFSEIGSIWPLILSGVVFVISAAALLGWVQMRWGSLPGTTAVWGSSPGGASATIIMSEAYGADPRLVALMQYLRVAAVALTASVIAHFAAPDAGTAAAATWFPEISWLELAKTLAVGFASMLVAVRLRVPAGPLLGPMFGCIALAGAGWLTITLPPWLLAMAYAVIGLSIGLRFDRQIIRRAMRSLPAIIASTAVLIAVCALFGMVLAFVVGLDPMTAYLATSPGGADSVAIIAASSRVDLPVIMAMQTSRLIAVMLVGPYLTRLISRTATP